MMLAELKALLDAVPERVNREDCFRLIEEENCLGKKTTSNRRLTAKHLAELYALDGSVTLFRLLMALWKSDPSGRPLLALLCAAARDPLLRLSADTVLEAKQGDVLSSSDFVRALDHKAAGRFTPATKLSIAQNVGASWAQAGHLRGKIKKIRCRPIITPANTTFALVLGYLCGLRGQFLLDSFWARLLDAPITQITTMAKEAARRGWLDYRGFGTIVDISFTHLLTRQELQEAHGPN